MQANCSNIQFEDEQSISTGSRPRRDVTSSFKNNYESDNKFQEFRQNELKGSFDPEIFSKQQYTYENSTDPRDGDPKLRLDFEPEDRNTANRLADEHQNQINKLNMDLDISSRYSMDNSEKPEIDVSFA